MFKKLYHTICKDTASKNESAKLIIVTRMLTILMICYTTLVMFSLHSYTNGLLFVGLWLLLFIGVLPLSYRLKTFTTFCFLNILILIWIAATILCFGWNIGTQQFLLALVVLCFFAKYGHEALKILYVVLLLLVRIALYLYSARHAPILSVEPVMGHTLQILNTLAIYVSISVIMVIFSNAPALADFRRRFRDFFAHILKLGKKHDPANINSDEASWDRIPTKIRMDELLSTDINVGDNKPQSKKGE